MRFMVVHPGPSFSVHDVFVGAVEALRDLGQQVATYQLDDRLSFYDAALFETGAKGPNGEIGIRKAVTHEAAVVMAANGLLSAAMQWWPDVVLGISAFFTPPAMLDLLRARGMKVFLWHTESPYQEEEQFRRAAHADLNLVNDPTNLEEYRQFGPAAYMPHAYRPSVHHPGPVDPALASDLAFVGTGFDSRIAFLEAMDLEGVQVLLAGQWQQLTEASPLRRYLAHDPEECTDNEQTASIYRSARMGLNLYRREAERPDLAEGWAMGPREVEMAACGLAFLRDRRPEGDEVLPMLPTFDGPEDATDKLRWWLAHDEHRGIAADQARAAIADRTFHTNIKQLLRLLDRQPANL